MRVLAYDPYGDFGGIAYMMAREGTQVDLYIRDPFYRNQMTGLVSKVSTLREGLKREPDFIIFSLNGYGKVADDLRHKGYKVVGGGTVSDKLEMDRAYGVKVASQFGIKTPKTTEFHNLETAISFIRTNKKRYAIKIDNNKSEASSYVGKSWDELIDYLEQSREEKTIGGGDTFILQEVIDGSEISTEMWFSDGSPIWPANSTFETKRFLAGELGQRTGCELSLVCHYQDMSGRIVDKTVRKLFPLLKYMKWTGPIDVNCIVSDKDQEPYFLEFTPRIGFSAIYAFAAILGCPISEFFRRVANGTLSPIPFKNTWGTSLKVSIPPYPVDVDGTDMSNALYGKTNRTRVNGEYGKDFIPIDCQKGKSTELMTAGTSCIVGECLGRGNTIYEAWRSSQKVFKSVDVPNQQGRYVDGISDPWKRANQLKQWGYDIPISEVRAGTTPFSAAASVK